MSHAERLNGPAHAALEAVLRAVNGDPGGATLVLLRSARDGRDVLADLVTVAGAFLRRSRALPGEPSEATEDVVDWILLSTSFLHLPPVEVLWDLVELVACEAGGISMGTDRVLIRHRLDDAIAAAFLLATSFAHELLGPTEDNKRSAMQAVARDLHTVSSAS